MANSSISVNAGEMLAALAIVVSRARSKTVKPYPVTITYAKAVATVTEAQYGLRSQQLPAKGKWAERVQVDGRRLRKVFDVLPADAQVELTAAASELVIETGKTQIRMPRLDLDGGIEQVPIPRDPKHQGKVEVPPDPVGKRVELADTWQFSARVPMPQHRDPEKK